MPSFPPLYTSIHRLNHSHSADEDSTTSDSHRLSLTDLHLIPGLSYFVQIRGALPGPTSKDLPIVSNTTASKPTSLSLPLSSPMEDDQDIDHCAAVVSLSLTRPKTASKDLSADLRSELLSLLHLEAEDEAIKRFEGIERVEGKSSQSKEEEVQLTISPLAATQRLKSPTAWLSTITGKSLSAVMKTAPPWLIAEFLRSSLSNQTGEIKKAGLKTLQRLQRVGPISLQCQVKEKKEEESAPVTTPTEDPPVLPSHDEDSTRPSPPHKDETVPPEEIPTKEDDLPHVDRTAAQPTDPLPPLHDHDAEARSDALPPLPSPADMQPPSNGFDEEPLLPIRPPGTEVTLPVVEEEDEGDDGLGHGGQAYAPPATSPLDDFTPGGEVIPPSTNSLDPHAGPPADDKDSFSVVGWLMSHTLVAALLVAACMGVVVYAVFFRPTDSNGFEHLQNEDADVERGEGSRSSGGPFNAGAGPFASLQSSASSKTSSLR